MTRSSCWASGLLYAHCFLVQIFVVVANSDLAKNFPSGVGERITT